MADNVDYLGYAQAMNQLNPYAALGQQVGGTLSDIAARQRTEREAAPARELADIQLQTARQGLEEDIAKRAATQQVMGGTDLTSTYAAQMRKAQRAEQTKAFTEGFDKLVASKSSPEALKRYTQAALSKDPDLATWAPYISYVDEGSIKITKPFGPNEAPDPTRPGSFLPPGVYTVTGSRTNDPTNPFAFQLIEPAKAEKTEETWGEPYAMSVGGKKAMVQKSSRGQIRPVVQDVSTTVKVSTGGGGAGKDFKNESAMRKEFLTLPEVKDFPSIEQNSKRALVALQEQGKGSNVAVDQSIITVFNKMLDPSSVVRESEYARTPQDLSVLSRIKGKWDKVQRGGAGLDSNERQALYRMVKNFNDIANVQYNEQVDFYSGLAKRYGYRPENIVRLGGKRAPEAGTLGAPPAALTKRPPLSSFRKR